MAQRHALGNIVKFAKREYQEKKPSLVQVLKVKNKSILTKGVLPSLQMFEKPFQIFFLVVSEYSDSLRLYYFDRNGSIISGANFDKSAKLLKELSKNTTKAYQIPKKEIILEYKDLSSKFKEKANRIVNELNSFMDSNIQLPYSIIASQNLKLKKDHVFGSIKKGDKFIIPSNAHKNGIIDIILFNEFFYHYLSESLRLISLDKKFNYILAIILTNLYFKNRTRNILVKFLTNQEGMTLPSKPDLNEIVKKSLLINNRILTEEEVENQFYNLKNLLHFFKYYEVLLDRYEFYIFIESIIKVSSDFTGKYFTKKLKNKDFDLFLFNLFNRFYIYKKENQKKTNKDEFLCLMMGLVYRKEKVIKDFVDSEIYNSKMENFLELIEEVKNLAIKNPVKSEIKNLMELINDMLIKYIFKFLILVEVNKIKEGNFLKIEITIQNVSNYTFRNFEYSISWTPKNRIELLNSEDIVKSQDLNLELKRLYRFRLIKEGKSKFYCKIKFLNPFSTQKFLSKKISLFTL
jgi:hypothetical protein